MCFLSKNSPHRPTASEPGKSATQAKVDGDYFYIRRWRVFQLQVVRAAPPALSSASASSSILNTASEASDNDSPEHFQERAC